MLIRLLTDRVAGYGVLQLSGDTVDVPEQEGMRLLARGQAESLEPECTTVAATEDAMRHTSRTRRK